LSFGSSITWELSGGGNFWKELTNEYQTNWSIDKKQGTTENLLQIKPITSSASASSIEIKCGSSQNLESMKKPFGYEVKITQSNRVST
jgi:hypothetical protein